MTQVIVTMQIENGKQMDLSLPWEIPCNKIVAALGQTFNLSEERQYQLLHSLPGSPLPIPPSETLAQAGVMMGDILELVPRKMAFLVFEDDLKFMVTGEECKIGRNAPGIEVDIDLTTVDEPKLVSRQHATIEFNSDNYYIVDNRSMNGILINDEKIEPESPNKLKDGDRIHFGGKQGICLMFKLER
jgi:hypothetical protein